MKSYFGKNDNVQAGSRTYHVQTQVFATGNIVCRIFEGGAVRGPNKEFNCSEFMYEFERVNEFASYVHRKIVSDIKSGALVPTLPNSPNLEQKTEKSVQGNGSGLEEGVEKIVVSEKEALAILLGPAAEDL